jgi:hypothetical protein
VSGRQMERAIRVRGLTVTERCLLTALASFDGPGGAWPSVATLADLLEVERRTIQRTLRSLEEKGAVQTQPNAGGNDDTRGDKRPNRYQLRLEALPLEPDPTSHTVEFQSAPPRGDTIDAPHEAARPTPRGDTPDATGRHQRRPNKPLNKSENTSGSRATDSPHPGGMRTEPRKDASEESDGECERDRPFETNGDTLKNMREVFEAAGRRAARSDEGGASGTPANDLAVRMRIRAVSTDENRRVAQDWIRRGATPTQCADALAERIRRHGRRDAAPRGMRPPLDSTYCQGCCRDLRPGADCPLRLPSEADCVRRAGQIGNRPETSETA